MAQLPAARSVDLPVCRTWRRQVSLGNTSAIDCFLSEGDTAVLTLGLRGAGFEGREGGVFGSAAGCGFRDWECSVSRIGPRGESTEIRSPALQPSLRRNCHVAPQDQGGPR